MFTAVLILFMVHPITLPVNRPINDPPVAFTLPSGPHQQPAARVNPSLRFAIDQILPSFSGQLKHVDEAPPMAIANGYT
jgi:hypothetical protein